MNRCVTRHTFSQPDHNLHISRGKDYTVIVRKQPPGKQKTLWCTKEN